MDELDKLKNDWKKTGDYYPKFSEKEIYAMLHKGSSSIVKWILIISILEFAFWLGLTFLLKDTQNAKMFDSYGVDYITIPMTVIGYGITIYFCSMFYINYRKISVTDNVRNLMDNILKTRKTVSNYIFVNLSYIVISSIVALILLFNNDKKLIKMLHQSEAQGNETQFYVIYIISSLLFIALFILIIWLFYKLIYGLLLKKLRRNYDELRKIDF